MTWHEDFLKKFFYYPVDKVFDMVNLESRGKEYASCFGVGSIEKNIYKNADVIASCMERSLLPEGIEQKFTEIRHPLSEEFKRVGFDEGVVIREFGNLLEKIGKNYINLSDERKSFELWRNLPVEIIQNLSGELKKYVFILPADTRIPDHSIWEHLKIVTALKVSESYQDNSLFLFTISSAQSFISRARKTQDFYMGSLILSYLTFLAMKLVIEKYGPTSIVYPNLYGQPLMDWYLVKKKGFRVLGYNSSNITLPTIPNRFVAIIGTTDQKEIKELAMTMKDSVKEEFKKAGNKILEKLVNDLGTEVKNDFLAQIEEFPEIYWVAIPWRKDRSDLEVDDLNDFFFDEKLKWWREIYVGSKNIGLLYQLLYTALEKSIGARKNLREFSQRGEKGRKCSVCGERNVLFFWESVNKWKFLRYNPNACDLTNKIPRKYISDGEGLCALCFVKRCFDVYLSEEVDETFKDFSFPPTSEIASANFKKKAIESAKDEFNKYVSEFFNLINVGYLKVEPLSHIKDKLNREMNLEGEWFYLENLDDRKIRDELGVKVDLENLNKLKEDLKRIYGKVGKPNSYYALIYLDGDNMGKWLAGELLPEIQYAYNSEVWEKKLTDKFKNKLSEQLKKINPDKKARKLLTPAIHSAISTALRNYSLEFVREIVEEEHLGKLIYAGGDDLLAFVNLRDLFDVMEKLRWAFSGQIKFEDGKIVADVENKTGFVLKDGVYHLAMGKNASCSMGVVIAHYKEPLKIVIGKVFEMGKKAKKEGRDRFAICLMKRRGEERIGVIQWNIKNDESALSTEILKKLKCWMDSDADIYISDGFIQKFKMEFLKLKEVGVSDKLVEAELKRLVDRAYNGPKDKKKQKEFVGKFVDHALKIYMGCGSDIDNFVNLIEISSFMNKGD
jgi:CRISPR-associated protein Cmr2